MEKRISPSDIKKMAQICKDITKSLNFENPIIEGKQLVKESKRFKKLMGYAIPEDDNRILIKENKKGEGTYEDIIFLSDSESEEFFDILQNEGEDAALKYLIDGYHYPGEHSTRQGYGGGTTDTKIEKNGYVMNYNSPLRYVSLSKKID